MLLIIAFFLSVFFLVGSFSLTALSHSLRHLQRQKIQKLQLLPPLFFYRPLYLFFFPQQQEFEGLFFSILCAQNIMRFCYAVAAYIFLSHTPLFLQEIPSIGPSPHDFAWFWLIISFLTFIIVGFLLGDFLPRLLGTKTPPLAIRLCAPLAALYLVLVFPITYIFLKITHAFWPSMHFDSLQDSSTEAKQEIMEIVHKAELSPGLNLHDKKLISAVLNFRERIVREVMVPRVNLFSLPVETTIKEAAQLLYDEGYSRIPVYKNSIDNIVGVLMYKDVLNTYIEYTKKGNDALMLDASIESIAKAVLYTPETKKISNLLQEFRKKQVHLAIVVDEYGGTEGVVTIEDILEEIVGDISDEYDETEELFQEQPDHSWIVDARLNIIDAEEHLGIEIPQEGDYDTIGGYIYHRTGTIPPQGFTIHHNTFEMEIISSTERAVEKVRITPVAQE